MASQQRTRKGPAVRVTTIPLDRPLDLDNDATDNAFADLDLRSAPEQIADRLITAIALGEYVAGQRLPTERELAALLKVGRASVRQAIHRLAALGYVRVARGRFGGAFVATDWRPDSAAVVRRTLLDNWPAFVDLLDLRRLLEPLIAEKAAKCHDADDRLRLLHARNAYREASDREASRVADGMIHSAVGAASHNVYLASLGLQIRNKLTLGFSAEPYSATIREQAIATHDELIDAILARKPRRAASAMASNIALTEDAIRDVIARVESE